MLHLGPRLERQSTTTDHRVLDGAEELTGTMPNAVVGPRQLIYDLDHAAAARAAQHEPAGRSARRVADNREELRLESHLIDPRPRCGGRKRGQPCPLARLVSRDGVM